MKRRVAIAAAALAVLAGSGCNQELHRWGAAIRGAPVSVSYQGHPWYVTGPAQRSFADCVWTVGVYEPWIEQAVREHICQANYTWVEGSVGYRQNG